MRQLNISLTGLQATPALPLYTEAQSAAPEDDAPRDAAKAEEKPDVPVVVAVLANAVGGILLLSGMFCLPFILAGLMK